MSQLDLQIPAKKLKILSKTLNKFSHFGVTLFFLLVLPASHLYSFAGSPFGMVMTCPHSHVFCVFIFLSRWSYGRMDSDRNVCWKDVVGGDNVTTVYGFLRFGSISKYEDNNQIRAFLLGYHL